MDANSKTFCSGVLVAPQLVLTAAHCVCERQNIKVSVGQVAPDVSNKALFDLSFFGSTGDIRTSVGVANMDRFHTFNAAPNSATNEPSDFCEVEQKVSKELPDHLINKMILNKTDLPQMERDWLDQLDNLYEQLDLAVIVLDADLQLNGVSFETRFAHSVPVGSHENIRVVGFGRNNHQDFGGLKSVLQGTLISRVCDESDEVVGSGCVNHKEIKLVDPALSSGSCKGDSGAGVFRVDGTGRHELFAITSREIVQGKCSRGSINVIVLSDEVKNWINSFIN